MSIMLLAPTLKSQVQYRVIDNAGRTDSPTSGAIPLTVTSGGVPVATPPVFHVSSFPAVASAAYLVLLLTRFRDTIFHLYRR
jgi:hypothetical protein